LDIWPLDAPNATAKLLGMIEALPAGLSAPHAEWHLASLILDRQAIALPWQSRQDPIFEIKKQS
jgi:hypothetical protein